MKYRTKDEEINALEKEIEQLEAELAEARWEVKRYNIGNGAPRWQTMRQCDAVFSPLDHYRRKPRMIRVTHEYPDGTVKMFKYPEPVRKPLKDEQEYWLAVLSPHGIHRWKWHGTKDENHLLGLGLIHLTKEAAEAHRRAMVGEDGDE